MEEPPLRILEVMRAPVGGLFRHVADLTRGLAAKGHLVGLVVDTIASDAQTEARLEELAQHAKLGIHRLPMPRLFGAADLTTTLAVRRLASRLEADVIHGHGAKGGFYARLTRFAGARGRVFYTPHGGVLHFSAASSSGRLFHALERRLTRQTAAILFESEFARATYIRLIGAPTCPTKVIYNGVAPAEFEIITPAADAADFVFVGELRQLKGIMPLVEALAQVRRPDGTPATLTMAGDGADRAALAEKIARLGLAERVSLVGSQPARRMFARGRIAVVPSLAESLPYVVLEAAAAGLPVIATRVGGVPEIFGPAADRLVTAGDAPALAAAMQAALDEPAACTAAAGRLRERVLAEFAVEPMVDAIEAAYREAVHTSRPAHFTES
jgi:glycosyltransferase involved in cell wall biosynthesis